ncbi:hypothetical protein BDW74DRAFT_77921 [Aspergillus multicolor]|uniref:uncharacterized protein n=1 Tax=Aspergillus multicolor TaxID=41759 RepID=UPI003CCE194D
MGVNSDRIRSYTACAEEKHRVAIGIPAQRALWGGASSLQHFLHEATDSSLVEESIMKFGLSTFKYSPTGWTICAGYRTDSEGLLENLRLLRRVSLLYLQARCSTAPISTSSWRTQTVIVGNRHPGAWIEGLAVQACKDLEIGFSLPGIGLPISTWPHSLLLFLEPLNNQGVLIPTLSCH